MSVKHRLLITEDQRILRAGLRALLSMEPDLEVVGETDNGREALSLVAQLAPDLVLIDVGIQGTGNQAAIEEIRQNFPGTQVLVLTQQRTDDCIRAALRAGASGYVLKDASDSELLMAVRSALAGKIFLSPSISQKIVNAFLDGGRGPGGRSHWDSLTRREREILKLVAEGHTSKYIAAQLTLSIKTVEKHRYNLMKKLDLHNVSALTTFAIGQGLVSAR